MDLPDEGAGSARDRAATPISGCQGRCQPSAWCSRVRWRRHVLVMAFKRVPLAGTAPRDVVGGGSSGFGWEKLDLAR